MIKIPLSAVGSAQEFAAAVAAHREALEAHRVGPPAVAVPVAHPLIESLVLCVPDTGPVADRGPDKFMIADYEIVDDSPPPPPEPPARPLPSLAEQKNRLMFDVQQSATLARNAFLSPARANLLSIDAHAALSIPEGSRTPDQVASIECFNSFCLFCADLSRAVALASIEVEDLDSDGIKNWKVPTFS